MANDLLDPEGALQSRTAAITNDTKAPVARAKVGSDVFNDPEMAARVQAYVDSTKGPQTELDRMAQQFATTGVPLSQNLASLDPSNLQPGARVAPPAPERTGQIMGPLASLAQAEQRAGITQPGDVAGPEAAFDPNAIRKIYPEDGGSTIFTNLPGSSSEVLSQARRDLRNTGLAMTGSFNRYDDKGNLVGSSPGGIRYTAPDGTTRTLADSTGKFEGDIRFDRGGTYLGPDGRGSEYSRLRTGGGARTGLGGIAGLAAGFKAATAEENLKQRGFENLDKAVNTSLSNVGNAALDRIIRDVDPEGNISKQARGVLDAIQPTARAATAKAYADALTATKGDKDWDVTLTAPTLPDQSPQLLFENKRTGLGVTTTPEELQQIYGNSGQTVQATANALAAKHKISVGEAMSRVLDAHRSPQ